MKTIMKTTLTVLVIFLLGRVDAAEEKHEIQIAVAANMSFAIKDLIILFNETHPECTVTTIIGSSGKLTAQIVNGAPFDLFLSANKAYPEKLWKKKVALAEPKVYAKGLLVLFSQTPQKFEEKGLKVLSGDQLKTIAIPNVKLAPYGAAAWEALLKTKLLDEVKPKLVYAQNIAQTLQYATSVADAGFISKSAILAPSMRKYNQENRFWIEVSPALYKPIEQAAVLLKGDEWAKTFYDFMFTAKAQAVLETWGYKK